MAFNAPVTILKQQWQISACVIPSTASTLKSDGQISRVCPKAVYHPIPSMNKWLRAKMIFGNFNSTLPSRCSTRFVLGTQHWAIWTYWRCLSQCRGQGKTTYYVVDVSTPSREAAREGVWIIVLLWNMTGFLAASGNIMGSREISW